MKYTNSHEWIVCNEKVGTVGISHYAQEELGEIVFVQLPKIDDVVEQGGEIAVLESTKAASDIYSPVSGTVIAINHQVIENPSLLNTSPEEEGWLYKIELRDASELDTLLDYPQYLQLIN